MVWWAMLLKIYTPKSQKDVAQHIKENKNLLVAASRTSTVIPYDKLEVLALNGIESILDLSCIPGELEMVSELEVSVSGNVTWRELREFLASKGLDVGCFPTDQSAQVLAGLATSATGERAFSHGTLREHCVVIIYWDSEGREQTLSSQFLDDENLKEYQRLYNENYTGFKNGPYPRLEKETDLMIGFEGQLGVIKSCKLKVFPKISSTFVLVPIQDDDFRYSDIIRFCKARSEQILMLEFFDKNSIQYAQASGLVAANTIALEVVDSKMESLIGELEINFGNQFLDQSQIMDSSKFEALRVSIPRKINEYLSNNQLLKKGTDCQVKIEYFDDVFSIYKELSEVGIESVLFGHLGDCHLHFNFLPSKSQVDQCDRILENFYQKILEFKGSPFAEHGIGLLKKKFIQIFYPQEVKEVFKFLKEKHDPNNKFFAKGFMYNE